MLVVDTERIPRRVRRKYTPNGLPVQRRAPRTLIHNFKEFRVTNSTIGLFLSGGGKKTKNSTWTWIEHARRNLELETMVLWHRNTYHYIYHYAHTSNNAKKWNNHLQLVKKLITCPKRIQLNNSTDYWILTDSQGSHSQYFMWHYSVVLWKQWWGNYEAIHHSSQSVGFQIWMKAIKSAGAYSYCIGDHQGHESDVNSYWCEVRIWSETFYVIWRGLMV